MSRRILEGCYARLRAIRNTIPSHDYRIPRIFLTDYNAILNEIRSNSEDKFVGFDVGGEIYSRNGQSEQVISLPMLLKINQLIGYLESVHQVSNKIIEIGSVYNSIKDEELKGRCGDLLSAPDHFDRVLNQATQVLEERVRSKLPIAQAGMYGAALINSAINNDPVRSIIVFSSEPSQQEGYAHLFRGVVGAFRNPSHHRFIANITREQALQICAFIDNMLAALESATISQVAR